MSRAIYILLELPTECLIGVLAQYLEGETQEWGDLQKKRKCHGWRVPKDQD